MQLSLLIQGSSLVHQCVYAGFLWYPAFFACYPLQVVMGSTAVGPGTRLSAVLAVLKLVKMHGQYLNLDLKVPHTFCMVLNLNVKVQNALKHLPCALPSHDGSGGSSIC